MKITKVKDNNYSIEGMTMGKLYALWLCLERKRSTNIEVPNYGLTPVEYDCWVKLNRIVEKEAPALVGARV